ncbi:hypothetical protein [Variovorax fucosicus]|uniref:hypothetical protein n=1 Tax=Variovorax fucosicus TaxID=3053517 RepID=UPI0025755FAF|nr:hypothetical protein [Variovorax sp. J22G47]MDM0059026.1 hypothetical protein [Variovorax sp. J22G47]
MNIDKVLSAIPSNETLDGSTPARRKKLIEDLIEVAISEVESDRRHPDVWETDLLLRAMGAVLARRFVLASHEVRTAMTLPQYRSPAAQHEPVIAMTIDQMRRTLDALRHVPID